MEAFSSWISLTRINKYGKGDFNSVSARLPCWLWKGRLKQNFLDIYLTTSFGVRKFKNTSAMRGIFFQKIFKIESKFWKCNKNSENRFSSWVHCIWECCFKLSLLTREYLLSAVNGLANSPKNFCITQREFLNLNCLHGDQKIW